MTKLSIAFLAAVSLFVFACKKGGDAGAGSGSVDKSASAGGGSAATGAPAANTGMPDCDAYVAAANAFMKCDKLPPGEAENQKQVLDKMKQHWGDPSKLTEDVKKQMNDECKMFVEAVHKGADSVGCTL